MNRDSEGSALYNEERFTVVIDFWSERSACDQRSALRWPLFCIINLFSSLLVTTVTHSVVVVVNLPSQAGTNCGQLYTNVYIHSHQIRYVKGLTSQTGRMPYSE